MAPQCAFLLLVKFLLMGFYTNIQIPARHSLLWKVEFLASSLVLFLHLQFQKESQKVHL